MNGIHFYLKVYSYTIFLFLISFLISLVVWSPPNNYLWANEYVIFAIHQDVSMGYKDEKLYKNFYINMGQNQGIKKGTLLDVYRTVSQYNPYQNNGQYDNYRLKIGELNVISSDEESSVANTSSFYKDEKSPSMEIKDFMIGDQVQIHIE
ncbi:MAG: hypothetical protein HQK49_17785 [Oligoflexia bacterium]|nr:hypothetical protein [Oligoflexia bacterium]